MLANVQSARYYVFFDQEGLLRFILRIRVSPVEGCVDAEAVVLYDNDPVRDAKLSPRLALNLPNLVLQRVHG